MVSIGFRAMFIIEVSSAPRLILLDHIGMLLLHLLSHLVVLNIAKASFELLESVL